MRTLICHASGTASAPARTKIVSVMAWMVAHPREVLRHRRDLHDRLLKALYQRWEKLAEQVSS